MEYLSRLKRLSSTIDGFYDQPKPRYLLSNAPSVEGVSRVLFCGVGANALLFELLSREFPQIRWELIDGLRFRQDLNPETLVILSSLSGNTTETLCILEDLLSGPRDSAAILLFTKGGILEGLAREAGLPLVLLQNETDDEYGGLWQLPTLFLVLRDALLRMGLPGGPPSRIVPVFEPEAAREITDRIVRQVVGQEKQLKGIKILFFEEDELLADLCKITLSELCYAHVSCARLPDYMHHQVLSLTECDHDRHVLFLYRDLYETRYEEYLSACYRFVGRLTGATAIRIRSRGDLSDSLGILFLAQCVAKGIIETTKVNAKHLMSRFKSELKSNPALDPEKIKERILGNRRHAG